MIKALTTTLTSLALAGAGLTIAAPIANATPAAPGWCDGHECDWKDPAATGCDQDAYAADTVYFRNASLSLMWSSHCKTSWAQLNVNPSATECFEGGAYLLAEQDTGRRTRTYIPRLICGDFGRTYTTDMIYTPTDAMRARFKQASTTWY